MINPEVEDKNEPIIENTLVFGPFRPKFAADTGRAVLECPCHMRTRVQNQIYSIHVCQHIHRLMRPLLDKPSQYC